MYWLRELLADPKSVEASLLIVAVAIAAGLAIGRISFHGIRLGVAGILFTGLILGHFGYTPDAAILGFAREFGLVLFVFAVGLSVGPGFFNALRSHGLKHNILAASVVALGVAITMSLMLVGGIAGPAAVGLFCGATTNTPSLAAAGQALRDYQPREDEAKKALAQAAPEHPLLRKVGPLTDAEREQLFAEITKLPATAYAVSYPGGVLGIIAAILLLQWMFRVDPVAEAEKLEAQYRLEIPSLTNMHVRVCNPNLVGARIADIPANEELGVVISRLMRGTDESVAHADTVLQHGDVLMVVGFPEKLRDFEQIVGEVATIDSAKIESNIQVQWLIVSRKEIAEHTLEDLAFVERYGVQLTRIRRSGVELPPLRSMRLHLGDEIRVVGLPQGLTSIAREVGDSPRQLGEPELLPLFVGISLGVLIGSIPFAIPGLPGKVKLGLAGGPLVLAIILSRVQRIGPMIWYLPRSANLALKDVGIALFLASVGLKSGDLFVEAFTQGAGFEWLVAGAVITLAPLLIVGAIARSVAKEHYLTIIGLLAGSMTDPPALAFANSLAKSEIPSLSYATVYPVTMILRIISAQLMMIYWTS
jgi:putative transport protein